LVSWSIGWLVGWSIGWLFGWSLGWLAGWSGKPCLKNYHLVILDLSPKAMGLMIWFGIQKGREVGRMYVPMSKLENKTLTKSLGPLL
jgi:hypothetical protein